MDLEEKKYWVAFNVFEGIGPLRFKLLYDFFGSAKEAFNAAGEKLKEVGLGGGLVQRFVEFRKTFDADSYFIRLEKLGISVLCLEEENYPKMLKEIAGKPPLIYVRSITGTKSTTSVTGANVGAQHVAPVTRESVNIFNKRAVAVVGTRKITGYGRQVTEMITEGLVSSGLVIVSGLARGVDEVAHETTLKCGGITIAVLGCGLDLIYPPEHKDLANEIVESGGALVSEFPSGMQAVPGNFPARNRIISGLSLGVVVTEAAEDSGSLITASCAGEQGREVFAVPGPITSPLSKGTSELIKKGAKLVMEAEDVLEELGIKSRGKSSFAKVAEGQNFSDDEKRILEILENESLHIDEICRKLNKTSEGTGGILSLLEIKGVVRNMGEGIYGLR